MSGKRGVVEASQQGGRGTVQDALLQALTQTLLERPADPIARIAQILTCSARTGTATEPEPEPGVHELVQEIQRLKEAEMEREADVDRLRAEIEQLKAKSMNTNKHVTGTPPTSAPQLSETMDTGSIDEFPPHRPAIELYSQMRGGSREMQRIVLQQFESWAHIYVNGEKLALPPARGQFTTSGFRVVQFDRTWHILSDVSYEIYHNYDDGGNHPQEMRDAIAAMPVGSPVAVIAGDATGCCNGNPAIASALHEAFEYLGASVFLDQYPRHKAELRFAYAGLLLRGSPSGLGKEAFQNAASQNTGSIHTSEPSSGLNAPLPLATSVLCVEPSSPAFARRDAFEMLFNARLTAIQQEQRTGSLEDTAMLQTAINKAEAAGVPSFMLECAGKHLQSEKERRTRTALEIMLRATAMESDPAACQGQALVPYLKLVQQYLRQGHEVKANCSQLVKRLSEEQKMAEDALQATLARSDVGSDLSELKHAIEVASAAGIADNVVASAQTFVSDIQRKRETITVLEAQLLSFQQSSSAAPDAATATALLRQAHEAGAAPTLIQAAEAHLRRAKDVDTVTALTGQLGQAITELGRSQLEASAALSSTGHGRYVAPDLIFGLPVDAARGLSFYCNMTEADLSRAKARGIDTIRDEFQALDNGDDTECLDYVLDCDAGSSDKTFQHGLIRDRDESGHVLPSRLIADGRGGTRGMRLADFVASSSARVACLTEPEVAALRLYSTAAFQSMNGPLRDLERHKAGRAHPLTATVSFLQDAVKKLRSIDAVSGDVNTEVVLWRGLANRSVTDEFLRDGGTELAPMSTTSSLKVAVQYSASQASVLLRLRTSSFMSRGADISFVSAFQAESEYLFPPLTYLKVEAVHDVTIGTLKYRIVDVQPMLS